MKKIYISIPFSEKNYTDQQNHAFIVATNLAQKGYDVVNPFDYITPKGATKLESLVTLFAKLIECDAVYMCKGWQKNANCTAEMQLAINYNKEIITE